MARFLCAFALVAVPLSAVVFAGPAAAQMDDERPPTGDEGGEGYAWTQEEDTGPVQPIRILATIGGGSGLRIIQNIDFNQQRAAPAYIDLGGTIILPSSQTWRHGFGLTFSFNLTGDGVENGIGTDPFSQFTFAPHYLAYFRFGEDWLVTGHAGVPLGIAVPSDPDDDTGNLIGLDLGGSATFYFTAGFGLYAELSLVTWMGGQTTFHPVANYEGGVVFDYEVLP
jgi:hypothetical protein